MIESFINSSGTFKKKVKTENQNTIEEAKKQ